MTPNPDGFWPVEHLSLAEYKARFEPPIIRAPCSWCSTPEQRDQFNAEYPMSSHTMCDACYTRMMAEAEKESKL